LDPNPQRRVMEMMGRIGRVFAPLLCVLRAVFKAAINRFYCKNQAFLSLADTSCHLKASRQGEGAHEFSAQTSGQYFPLFLQTYEQGS